MNERSFRKATSRVRPANQAIAGLAGALSRGTLQPCRIGNKEGVRRWMSGARLRQRECFERGLIDSELQSSSIRVQIFNF